MNRDMATRTDQDVKQEAARLTLARTPYQRQMRDNITDKQDIPGAQPQQLYPF